MAISWYKTVSALNRLGIQDGFYLGRRVITRDSRIDDGISIGEQPREAVVVDFNNSEVLKEMYYSINDDLRRSKRIYYLEGFILQNVFDSVKEKFPFEKRSLVDNLLAKYGAAPDQKISLDIFLYEGIGTCVHSSLTCGVLLEKFIDMDIIHGKVSVDRNCLYGRNGGGHAWCRYTSSLGQVVILDVMLDFIGDISNGLWDYKRPEEK